MKRSLIACTLALAALALWPAPSSAQTMLPFPVLVGGQKAVLAKDSDPFAKVADPVAADAELEVLKDGEVAMVIINAFPADAAGKVKDGANPAILMAQPNTKKLKLDATLDKKKLEPGYYVMNIVAGDNTARVMIQVK